MGNYHYIHPAFKYKIFALSLRTSQSTAARVLGVSQPMVSKLKKCVLNAAGYDEMVGSKRMGRPQKLDVFNIAFLEGCIEKTPDLELSELQQMLYDNCGLWVCEKTIENELKWGGFSQKHVMHPALECNEEQRMEWHTYM
ncbi:hypothetical protein Moror_11500 [Moniliophthora roreri MCA 2997]|uniref:Uncharacterized protein n=1 Tax=Moniliophthora roreri (strain MCA 2997) TaxID=1381753 RepID=V2WV03_MONRO|nr:hypothetical protein Moror_11500 [Moniliophthora roreri MCA 2997]